MALAIARLELLRLAEQEDERRNIRRERVIRDNSKAFELNDRNFRRLFRLEKTIVLELCEELRRPLSGQRSTNLPVDSKICDYDLVILQANANFPGSTHDTYIYKKSKISEYLERMYQDGVIKGSWLLGVYDFYIKKGDSGYPLCPWLITPIVNPPLNSPEERFSKAQQSARSVIERCNGVLKQRFRCLLKDRALHYAPEKACKIIYACVILHNICRLRGVPDDFNELDPLDVGAYGPQDQLWEDNRVWEQVQGPTGQRQDDWFHAGSQTRAQIIRRRFN